MQDIATIFKCAIIFPMIVAIIISIMIIPYLADGNYNLIYGGNKYCENFNIYSSEVAGDFTWPTTGFKGISSYFGRRVQPTTGASTYHAGIDILAYQGTEVKSIQAGEVIFAGWSSSGGYMVKIKHANNLISSYCHLGENIYVKKGDFVENGQAIGTVGPKYVSNGKLNGATTGVHLHLGVTANGTAIDPLSLF